VYKREQGQIRVLIAEDNGVFGEILGELLEAAGYTIVGRAADGLEAVAMAEAMRPDVVLMDIQMPKIDGIEAAQRIYESCPTPVVVLSAHDAPDLVERASQAGAGAYLVKPVTAGEMERAITIAIARFADQVALQQLNAKLQAEIAERQRAEAAFQDSDRQLESRERFITSIVESIPSSLVVIDHGLRVVSANRNFLEKTRREAAEILGHKIQDVFPPVLVEYTHMGRKVREVFRTGLTIEGGKVAYRASGLSTRIYFYRLVPLKHTPSHPPGGSERLDEAVENVLLLMDDITDREQLGEEVRLAERHLASVVECANDLVVSIDPQGQIMTWNQAAERISGMKAEQVKGQSLLSLCAAEQQPVMAAMLRQLALGEGVQNAEANLLTANGREVPISWSCSPMCGDGGEMIGIVAVGRDLTERRQLEAQLVQSAKMASLGVMAGGIAHELRNPLGIVSAAAQLLLERPNDVSLRTQAAQKIYAATERASLIIENLLKFARPQDSRMQELDLRVVLEEALALLAHQISLQKVTVRKEFQPGLPLVYGNPDLLQQVFTNLILNACNAMGRGGALTVFIGTDGPEGVEIRFRDTGRGISPDHLSKIFDPFFTTMPVGKGSGLGLSISYSIIQQHRGTIEVESQVGQGTTFTVRLPTH
jgi:PAS domain S-box-containing protein